MGALEAPSASLAGVLPGALHALGVRGIDDPLDLTAALGEVHQLAVVLIDGLGYHLLTRAAAAAPLFAELLAGRVGTLRELACGFPSTTPASLVSLGTGQLPGAHGILGFTVNVPGSDRVLTHVMWRDDPSPEQWQPAPRLLDRHDLSTAVVASRDYAGSGLTRAAYGDARYRGTDRVARGVVAELRSGTRLVYGYHSTLDVTAHLHGVASSAWLEAAAGVAALITHIAERLPPGAALLVTADHGCIDVAADDRFDLDTDPRLGTGVRVVAGEPRVRYLHTADGATPDVVAAWTAVLGPAAAVLTRDEAIDAGWFGPVPATHRERIGDVVVVCRAPVVVLASAHEPAQVSRLVGFHGALDPAETAVPLMIFR